MMGRSFILLCIVLCLAAATSAQATEPADQQETVRALVQEVKDQQETIRALAQEVKELKAHVAVLEARQAPEAPPPTPTQPQPPATAEAVPAAPQYPASESGPLGIIHGIQWQGFGSVTYKANDAKPPEAAFLGFRPLATGNFAVGHVDLFLTSQLTAKTSVLSEIVFTEGDSQEFQLDVERFLLKYDPNDYLKMSFGRFHTATSYYNSVFHHGLWLQTAADRPLPVEFADQGGLLPTQAVGVSMTGAIPSGKLGLNYIFEYASADTLRPPINTPNAAEVDEENGNEITAGFFIKPDWLLGFNLGGSFYHDRLIPDNASLHIDQSIGSAHIVYVTPRFEFLNEGFLFQHKVGETGQTFNTPAFYTLISEKFGKRWRPYFRYQYTNAAVNTPLFPDVGLRHGPSPGLRVELNDYIALKLQYDRIYRRQQPTINDALLQLAFRF